MTKECTPHLKDSIQHKGIANSNFNSTGICLVHNLYYATLETSTVGTLSLSFEGVHDPISGKVKTVHNSNMFTWWEDGRY